MPQDHSQATFAPPLKKEDGRIDWSLDAEKIYNRIRGLQPWPGVFTSFLGKRCNIWGAPLSAEGLESDPDSARRNDPQSNGTIASDPAWKQGCRSSAASGTVLRVEQVQLEGRVSA